MRISANKFETVLRQKGQAAGEAMRPAKTRRREQAEPTQISEAPAVPMPAEEPTEETPARGVVPGPAGTEAEEGEILATTESVMVVLDPEEEAPAAADAPEAGQVTIVVNPPAIVEPEAERAPPIAG